MKIKNTKRALLMSALSVLMCVSMLVGSTFAWFTDSVTSSGNIIKSGTLDVTMEWADGKLDPENATWTDASVGAIFNSQLWEPGYTDAKHLKISNKGNLALKYQLSIVPNGEVSELADVIDVYYVEEAKQIANRDDVDENTKIGKLSDLIQDGIHFGSLEAPAAGEEEKAYTATVVLKMQEDAGNQYQNLSIGSDFSVYLFATQYTSEFDSFDNQYDKNSGWTGDIAKPEQDDEGVFQISSPEELAWFANYVNGTLPTTFAADTTSLQGHNAVLTADINLNNLPWTPIGRTITADEKAAGHHAFDFQFHGKPNQANYAVFDGQGHTVYNLNVNENANAGLFGAAVYAVIKNVNVDGAQVVSNHFAGTILAQGYARVENCDVKNATVICSTELVNGEWDNGDKVGGVVGKISEGGNGSVYGVVDCSAENVTVTAYRDAGGILGYAGDYANVTGNKITNVTLIQDTTHDYKKFATVAQYNINSIVGDSTRAKGVIVNDNEGTATIVPMVTSSAALKDSIADAKEGDTIAVGNGEFTLPSLADKSGVTFEGNVDTVIGGTNASTGFGANFGKDNTFNNLTFNGTSNGVRWSYANGGTTTFENCTFAGDSTYGFHIDSSNGATFVFNNCTFVGFNAFAGDLASVTFKDCAFLSNGSYGHTNIWSTAYFNNCTFGDETSVSGRGDNCHLYFDGVEETYHHEYIGSAASLVEFENSVNQGNDAWNGQKVVLVSDIDLAGIAWEPIGQTGYTQFTGTFDGQGHTISNMTVNNVDESKYCSSGLFGWLNGTVKNVTLDKANVNGYHLVGGIAGYVERATVENCIVNNSTFSCTNKNDDANGDKAGAVVGQIGATQGMVINCSASNCTVSAGRDAGQIVGAAVGALANNVSGCSASNVTVSANGTGTGNNINNEIIGRK